MQKIEYRIVYSGVESVAGASWAGDPSVEFVEVYARDTNSGFGKALKRAKEPLGNGRVREIASVEFSLFVSRVSA